MATYKRLLLRHEVKTAGNCNVLDNTSILYALKDSAAVSKVRTDAADISTMRRYDLEIRQTPIQNDHDYVDAPNFNHLGTNKVAAVGYIAGYVVKMVKKSIQCNVCQDALVAEDPTVSNFSLLVKHKGKGGLIKASLGVFQICESTESCLTRMLNCTGGKLPGSSNTISAIQSMVLEEAVQKGVFSSLQDHMFERSPEDNHVFSLTKCITQCFLKIRMYHLAKERTAVIKGENIRKPLSKLILFKNQ